MITVTAKKNGNQKQFQVRLRFDAAADIRYYQHGGILPMVVRKKLEEERV